MNLNHKRAFELTITRLLRFTGGGNLDMTLGGLVYESAANSITAFAGGGQSSATQLSKEINRVTTVATAGDSVKLPVAAPGLTIVIVNKGANALAVFPSTADAIDGLSANSSVTQMPNSMVIYSCAVAGQWDSEGLATGYSGSLQTLSFSNGITAFAGGGQASATALTSMVNRVTTVATAGDSVKLPVSAAGMTVMVTHAATSGAGMDVFPATGDAINNLAANAALRQPPGTTLVFACEVAGTWNVTVPQPMAKYTKNTTAGATTAAAGDLTGAAYVQTEYSAVGTANLTTRTAAQMIADGFYQVGDSYVLEITNTSAGTTTLVGGTGVTITGTATLATNTTRRFNVKVTAAATITIQSTGVGTIS